MENDESLPPPQAFAATVNGVRIPPVLSGQQIIGEIGLGLAAAVLLDAFILRTLLVPAVTHLSGRASWWLPGWLDRILPRLSIEPAVEPAVEPAAQLGPAPGCAPAHDVAREVTRSSTAG